MIINSCTYYFIVLNPDILGFRLNVFDLNCILGVVPEIQCAVKRKEKKAQREKDKPNSTTDVTPEIIKIEPTEMKVIIIIIFTLKTYTYYNV